MIMYSQKDKKDIKSDILDEINKILKNNHIPENLDDLTVLNLSDTISYLGNIKILDENKLDNIEKELKVLFDRYGSSSLRSEEIVSCCRPSYMNISFKVNIELS